jgi:hypothetical protein
MRNSDPVVGRLAVRSSVSPVDWWRALTKPLRSAFACRSARPLCVACVLTLLASGAGVRDAQAEEAAKGFSAERLDGAPPGAAWLVMDDLNLRGKLGGAVTLSGGYARNPFHVESVDRRRYLDVISGQSSLSVGMAILYDRYRFYLNITNPLYVKGNSGRIDGNQFESPSVDLGKYPDKVVDVRLGFDARLFGDVAGPFRLGLGTQLFVPSGERAAYATDGTYRAMVRALFAGSPGVFSYAGHVGVHLRPRREAAIPGGPNGSELLFGAAMGPRLALSRSGAAAIMVGPEIFGQTAFRSLFGRTSTGVEALMTARFEQTNGNTTLTRFKLGFGEGLNSEFGAPDWRCVFGVEILGRVE